MNDMNNVGNFILKLTSTLKEKNHIQSAANEFNDVVLEEMYKTDDNDQNNVRAYCLRLEGNEPKMDVADQEDSLSIHLVMEPK